MSTDTRLLETCIEGGPLTAEDIQRKLAGTANTPAMKAVVSKLEYFISDLRDNSETPGTDPQARHELSGAIYHLKRLRRELLQQVDAQASAE